MDIKAPRNGTVHHSIGDAGRACQEKVSLGVFGLGNMRALGVQNLITSCLNDACRHAALIDVSGYHGDTEVPGLRSWVKYGKCGGRNTDVRPNWKEQPPQPSLTGKQWR
jgi:hypothetical protein